MTNALSNSVLDGDCLSVMRSLEPQSVDLVVCDLPYGKVRAAWDCPIDLDELWACYAHACKPECPIILFATQPFTSALVSSNSSAFKYDIVWVKNKTTGHLNARKMPLRKHETILVFCATKAKYTPQMTSGHKPVASFHTRSSGSSFGEASAQRSGGGSTERYPTSVIHFPVLNNDSKDRIHSAQKPVELLRYLVRTYSDPGATVLDNCSGSGALAIAALCEERSFICIEKDVQVAAASRARIAAWYATGNP